MAYMQINKTYVTNNDIQLTSPEYDMIVVTKPNVTIELPYVFNKKIIIEGNYEDDTHSMPIYVKGNINNIENNCISKIQGGIILEGNTTWNIIF
jgi:hypothetical protein